MGKWLIGAGFLVMILGCIATVAFYSIQLSQSFNSTMNIAENADAAAAKFCTENEKLVKNTGPSEYRPGQGYSRSVTYYCEDSEGHRRNITQQFADTVVSGIGGVFGSLLSVRWEFVCLSGLGLLVMIVGIVISVRRRRTPIASGAGDITFSQ